MGSCKLRQRFLHLKMCLFSLVRDDDKPPYPTIQVVEDIPDPAASPDPIPRPVSPPPDIDLIDAYIARVLEIIPAMQLTHVHSLLMQHCIETYEGGTVELVLHTLFEDPSYPKIDKGEKKGEDVGEEGEK